MMNPTTGYVSPTVKISTAKTRLNVNANRFVARSSARVISNCDLITFRSMPQLSYAIPECNQLFWGLLSIEIYIEKSCSVLNFRFWRKYYVNIHLL